MTERPSSPRRRWRDVAREAPAAFFELVEPVPQHRWAGGYGSGRNGPVSLEVLHLVDGFEISVWTSFKGQPDPGFLRGRALDVLLREFVDVPDPLREPLTMTVSPTTRSIPVNGEPTEFSCLEWDSGPWVGVATPVGNGTSWVSLQVPGRVNAALAIRSCTDIDMPDRPLHA